MDDSSVDAILARLSAVHDDVKSVGDDLDVFSRYVDRKLRSLLALLLFWSLFTLLGVSAILFEIGRLRGVL